MKHVSIILGAAALASTPALAEHHESQEDGAHCEMMEEGEMSCPMHEGEGEMNCPMMDHEQHGEGSDSHRMMNHGDGECPMMDHSRMGERGQGHPHRREHPADDQETESESSAQDHSEHEEHAPE